jgi:hypothetical protein
MGSSASKTAPELRTVIQESPMKHCLRIERIVAAQCDYLPPNRLEDTIRVGVIGNTNPENPLSGQAIRIGDSEAYRLQSFQDGKDSLTYTFEKDVRLTVMKHRDSIVYNLKTPDLDVTKEINPSIVKMYKPIGMASEELDKMGQLFQMK